MNLESMISIKGLKKYNNDIIGRKDNLYFVLDGATSLFYDNNFSPISDVYVYMQKLYENIENDGDLTTIITNAIAKTTKYFNIEDMSECKEPTFTVAMIRVNDNDIEYYVIGDAVLIVRKIDDMIESITENRLDELEEIDEEEIADIPNGSNKESLIKNIRRETRMTLNQANGYTVTSIKKESALGGMIGRYQKNEVNNIILCSDGFTAIPFDDYEKFNSVGIEEHINQIFDRIEKRDDISIILLSKL